MTDEVLLRDGERSREWIKKFLAGLEDSILSALAISVTVRVASDFRSNPLKFQDGSTAEGCYTGVVYTIEIPARGRGK